MMSVENRVLYYTRVLLEDADKLAWKCAVCTQEMWQNRVETGNDDMMKNGKESWT